MDGQRFDDLARVLARGTSRRQVLKGLAASAVGGALVAFGVAGAPRGAAAATCTLGDDSTCDAGQECCPVHNSPGDTICIAKGSQCAQQNCAGDGSPCVYASECCSDGATCTGNVCTPGSSGQCTLGDNSTCNDGEECCPVHNQDGATICIPQGTKCAQQSCANDGSPCVYDSECCSTGATCTGGVCTPAVQCVAPGDACTADGDCCQGTCIRRGNISQVCACGDSDHPFAGCTCNGGVQGECGDLICCSSAGTPGGPGTCKAEDACTPSQCAAGGEQCSQGSDCCSGKCNSDGICYCTDPDRPPIGCPCTAGDTKACAGRPELCCAGTCISPMATCNPPGQCAGAGDSCGTDDDCCAGTCDPTHKICFCTDPTRPALGCPCTTGTQSPCGATSLDCCATTDNGAGGPGICTDASVGCTSACSPPGGQCKSDDQCCAGKCSSDGACFCTDPARPGVGCPCTTGTQNPCGDSSLVCCANTNRPGGPGTCTSASIGCGGVVLPNTGSGGTAAAGSTWVGPAALIGAGAAFVASRLRRTVTSDSE